VGREALSPLADATLSCVPSTDCQRIAVKYVVTSLFECRACWWRFRSPQDRPSDAAAFYQDDYSQGFTTDCPSDTELERLKAIKFTSHEKDYGHYIQTLRIAGLPAGSPILNFGCSWGHGSWHLREAGYRVYSYKISRPRANMLEPNSAAT
jgi:hypothetical protein